MYLSDTVAMILRRWYIFLGGLLVIAVASVVALVVVPTQYQAFGQMLLLLSPDQGEQPSNPYLNLQPGLSTTAVFISGAVTDKSTMESLAAAGLSKEYDVALNPGSGPLLAITVKDTNPDRAIATRDELIHLLNDELERIQTEEHVQPNQMIHSRSDNLPNQAEALPGSKLRAIAVLSIAGIVVTIIIAITVDRAAAARRKKYNKKKSRNAPPEDAPPSQVDHAPDDGPTRRRRSRRPDAVALQRDAVKNAETTNTSLPNPSESSKIVGAKSEIGPQSLRLGPRQAIAPRRPQ